MRDVRGSVQLAVHTLPLSIGCGRRLADRLVAELVPPREPGSSRALLPLLGRELLRCGRAAFLAALSTDPAEELVKLWLTRIFPVFFFLATARTLPQAPVSWLLLGC